MIWLWMAFSCVDSRLPTSHSIQRFSIREVRVQKRTYSVEYACTPHEVALGLRYRSLSENEGAILCATSGRLTMKKMKSPITVAFVSSEKVITSLVDMHLEEDDVELSPTTKWVWEMPLGWFAKNNVGEGMLIDGL